MSKSKRGCKRKRDVAKKVGAKRAARKTRRHAVKADKEATPHGNSKSKTASPPPVNPVTPAELPPIPKGTVLGTLRIGGMRVSRDKHRRVVNADLRQLLNESVPVDTVVEAEDCAEFTVIDVDAHHLIKKWTDEALNECVASMLIKPDAWWVSHGKGLKFVFIGKFHRARAVAAALSVPVCFHVELITHTRHPRAARSDKPGTTCGLVHFEDTDPAEPFKFEMAGKLTTDARDDAVAALGLSDGTRFDHDNCPIDPSADSDAKGCVVVSGDIVVCHRCKGKGISVSERMPPGIYPLRMAIHGHGETDFKRLAKNRVHWVHAKLELKFRYPHLGEKLLNTAYRLALQDTHAPDDPRVQNVFNPNLDVVLGDVWLDCATLQPTRVDSDTCAGLPYCQFLIQKEDGVEVGVDPVKRAKAKFRSPTGYARVQPYRGISFRPPGTAIPILVQPAPKHLIELLTDPIPDDEAFEKLSVPFPQLDANYVRGATAAVICAEVGGGQPPTICTTGPSGSGKGEGIRLVASLFGEDAVKVGLTADAEVLLRLVGMMLAAGHRFIVFDEVGKLRNLQEILAAYFQLGAYIDWRPLYSNSRVRTPCRAAFFMPCVRFPDYLKTSAEFLRRTNHKALFRKAPNWRETSGGDTTEWRDRNPENARIGNSILTHVWKKCHAHAFNFSKVAEEYEFGSLASGDEGLDPQLLRSIYRHARGQDGSRILFEKDPTFARGWINLDAAPAKRLVSTFVALDDANDLKQARRIAQSNLEAAAWNDVLGIESPPIQCRIKIHGSKWGLRFQSAGNCLRGQETVNEDLPAIPGDGVLPAVVLPQSNDPIDHVNSTMTAHMPSAAPTNIEHVLRAGGLIA